MIRGADLRRVRRQRLRVAALAVAISVTALLAGLWYAGLIDLSRWRGPTTRSTAGLTPVPVMSALTHFPDDFDRTRTLPAAAE